MPALHAVHDSDPAKALTKRVGSLKEFTLLGNAILVAIYMRPSKAKFRTLELHIPDATKDEDKHQGKVGLIVKQGPRAWESDETYDFHGERCNVGDWVVLRPADGWPITLTQNEVLCRVVTEAAIRMKIPSPDAVW